MVIRNDDVNANVRTCVLDEFYGIIHEIFPEAEILSGVTIFAEWNYAGSIYKEVPFKNKDFPFFYRANAVVNNIAHYPLTKVASHGLYHVDHSRLSHDAQEMNILGSCRFLDTNIFIPPFNRYNEDTIKICKDNHIELVRPDGWKSLEFGQFDPNHEKWYFHSWRMTPEKLRRILERVTC